jgi:hypothetical protein
VQRSLLDRLAAVVVQDGGGETVLFVVVHDSDRGGRMA